MYESYYGLSEKPFSLTPDPKYLYLSARHTEAFAHLEFGRKERGGFVVITGEVGTGKTTLARYFLAHLGETTDSAVVLYPAVTAPELLRTVLDDLHVVPMGASMKDLVDALHRFLLSAREAGRQVVLLIDEAQDLSTEVIEQIRLLSNLETDTEKLLTIVLMGQSEFHEMLERRELRQLAQRVTARYHLTPLDRAETEEYLRHRLRIAGGEGKVVFTPGALTAIQRLSGGVPRLVNLICDRALLGGYVAGTRSIGPALVARAADEVRGGGGRLRRRAPAPWLLGGLAAVLLLTLVLAAARGSGRAALATATPEQASSPTPAASAASPVPSSPQPTVASFQPLEPELLRLERTSSQQRALDAVRSQWSSQRLESVGFRSDLDQLRRFDLPAVLEMSHPARRDTCFIALLGLDGDTARVGGLTAYPLVVRTAELDRFWTRQATFVWPDRENVRRRRPREIALWASQALARLDVKGENPVVEFQTRYLLPPDGLVGDRTLLALYAAANETRPRLAAPKPAPGRAAS